MFIPVVVGVWVKDSRLEGVSFPVEKGLINKILGSRLVTELSQYTGWFL